MMSLNWPAVALLSIPCATIAADCVPTPHRTTGTHYQPVAEEKTDVSRGVVVRGRVLAAPDCKPVANARVAHWQADENGHYVDRLRAYLYSDESGAYEFETEWPNLPVPHIHFIVSAGNFRQLETQWVGDERVRLINFDLILRRE